MKKIYILLFAFAAAVGMTGCTSEMPEKTADEGGDILIRLQVDALETKSVPTGDENYVESLQLLIFKNINDAPVACLTPTITAGGGPFEQNYANAAALAAGLTGADLKTATIFAVANYTGDLSSVANLAAAKAKTVDAAAMVSNTSEGYKVNDSPRFVMTAEGGFEVGSGADAGKAVASLLLKRLASKVSLTITYDQDLSDPDSPTLITTTNADGTTTVWTPMTEGNVRVYLQNAVSNATLGGFASSQTRFTYADVQPAGEPLKASAFYTYPPKWDEGSDDAPFIKIIQPWSYKTMKDDGTPGSPKPVVVDESTVELYYKVMFPGMTELAGNTDYQFTVQLTVLGGESTRDMKEITPTGFSILPWGNTAAGSDLSPVVSNPAKYLAVERNSIVVNNGAGVSIRYVASGPATLTVNQIYKDVYLNSHEIRRYIYYNGGVEVGVDDPNTKNIDERYPNEDFIKDKYDYEHDGSGVYEASHYTVSPWFTNTYPADPEKPNEGVIVLNHKLSTSIKNASFAARPYTYSLTLSLDGVPDEDFTITQVPSILAEGVVATGFYAVNGNTGNAQGVYRPRESGEADVPSDLTASCASGRYAFFSPDETSYDAGLGRVSPYRYLGEKDGTTGNNSRYRFIVQVAPRSGLYVIDPRGFGNGIENIFRYYKNTNKSSSASTIEGSPLTSDSDDATAIMNNYKPAADEDASHLTKTTYLPQIAPEFMVASSFSKGSTLRYETALLRCLSLQEDGYPAGRWRLPTEAEIEYCMDLQNKGAIPALFTTGTGYWASSGRVLQDAGWSNELNKTGTNNRFFVRCVYDTWYWGREEVEALKDGIYEEGEGDDKKEYQKYKWSGWGYITK